jgi:beta-1,4-mannosyl-glycoprotein beta-1,4-N-acetylglucosaminyltransferase
MSHGIVDCFPYFNEKELLELRINLLKDRVDQFIIVDADHTHGGHAKPFTCWNTIKESGIDSSKVTVIEAKLPSIEETQNNWDRERLQRNAASRLFRDGYVYIVSDCDEIVNPKYLESAAQVVKQNPDKIVRLPLIYLNCRADLVVCHPNNQPMIWKTPFMCSTHHLEKYTLSDHRESFAMNMPNPNYSDLFPMDQQGNCLTVGWHFSWMGDNQRLKLKMSSFLHCYDNNSDIFSTAVAPLYSPEMNDYLTNYRPQEGSFDPYGRTDHILRKYPLELLPEMIFELPRVKEFLLPG